MNTSGARKVYRIALIGFGNVGQGFVTILRDHGAAIAEEHGAEFRIVAVCDPIKGSIADADGFDPNQLVDAVAATGKVDRIKAAHRGWNASTTIAQADADVVVELSYTDLKSGEPATSYLRQALSSGKHVITTNKGPIALHFDELAKLSSSRGLFLGLEGAVMSGTPVLRAGLELLRPARITRIEGIVNGTTNYILTEMHRGLDYGEALAQAQRLGFAEADPRGDVDGHDAAAKAAILARLYFDTEMALSSVQREGISSITEQQVREASQSGERWKLIATVGREGTRVSAEVRPRRVPSDHPLAGVTAATNALTFHTELLGAMTLVGPGAGRVPTGFAIVSDLLALHRKSNICHGVSAAC